METKFAVAVCLLLCAIMAVTGKSLVGSFDLIKQRSCLIRFCFYFVCGPDFV